MLDEIGIGNIGSIDLIEIGMDLEHEFEIEIDGNEEYEWSIPLDIVNNVLKELGEIYE